MIPELMKAVIKRELIAEEAVLDVYRRVSLKDRNYPGIIQAEGSSVPGIYYERIDLELMACLDKFEGDEYRRDIVSIKLRSGRVLDAYVYLMSKIDVTLITENSWDLEAFRGEYLEGYLE